MVVCQTPRGKTAFAVHRRNTAAAIEEQQMAQESKRASPKGYDLGTAGLTALVASPQFVQDLREAEVVACSYGWETSSELGHRLPLISLGAVHEEPLRRAFVEFRRWQ
jgi:hypothetical protein